MLKDALYHIFIYPLESLLGFVLSILQGWCHSYGLSIILLSLLVNLFLLKLFFIADKASRNHALIKSKLDKKIAEFKRVFKGGELYAYIKTLYRQNHYHPIYALKALGGLALQVPFFVAVVSLLEFHSPELKGIKFGVIPDLLSPDGLLWGINLLPLLMTFFTLCNVWVSSEERGARIQGGTIALVFLVLLYKMPSALLLYWTTSMAFALIKSVCVKYIHLNKKEEKPSQEKRRSFIAKIFNACFTKYSDLSPQDYKLYRNISIFAILNLCTLIFLYNPFSLYASDVSQFDPKETWNTLGALFGFFLLTSFLLVYTTSFFYKTRLLKLGAYGFCVILLLAMTFNFIVIADYGPMDAFVFLNPILPGKDFAFLGSITNIYIVFLIYVILGCIAMMGVFILFLFAKTKTLIAAKISISIFLILSTISFVQIFSDDQEHVKQDMNEKSEKEKLNTDFFTFSKEHGNVLIVLLDGYIGSHFGMLLKDFPNLRQIFDGFVYYDNVVAVGGYTKTSIYSIVGGEKYSPISINSNIKGALEERLLQSYYNVNKTFIEHGYNVMFSSVETERLKVKDLNILPLNFSEHYKSKKGIAKTRNNEIGVLVSYGIFKIFPVRSRIYRNGMWLWNSNEDVFINTFSSRIAPFEAFVDFATSKSIEPTFKFMHTYMAHRPFGFDAKTCMPSLNPNVLDIPENDRIATSLFPKYAYSIEMQYTTSYCNMVMIGEMLKKMKDLGIYDNSLIIFVSDHGDNIYTSFDLPSPIAPPQRFDAADALLLVKMPNQKGELKVDHHLMSNADVPMFFCSVLEGGCPNVPSIRDILSDNREVFFTIMRGHDLRQQKEDSYILDYVWKIKGDRRKIENWTDVTEDANRSPRALIQKQGGK